MPIEIPQVRRIAFDQQEIGMGFNSDTGLAVGTALDFDTPTAEAAQEASASASIVNTHEAVMDSLNLSFEAEGRYAFSSASLKTEFAKKSNFNSVSTFVVARMVVQNQITRGRNFRIRPEAKTLLDTNQFDMFDRAFGDSFVRGRMSGGEFYAVMRITSVDTSVQTSLGVLLQAEINGVVAGVDFKGELTKANQHERTRSEFHVTFYQRGGSAGEIGTTLSVDEIKTRLRDFPTAVANHPFPYEVELATYDTIPIPTPPKFQQEQFVQMLADANKRELEFLQKRNDFEFAAEHPEYFEDPPPAGECRDAAQTFLRAANAAFAHAVRLSRGEVDPPQFFDITTVTPPIVLPTVKLRKKSLDQRAFRDWYLARNDPALTQDDHMLVLAIAAAAAEKINDFAAIPTEAAKAEALEAVVAGFDDVFLGQIDVFENEQIVKLKGVEHLGGMLPPGVTKLDLGSNNIAELKGIERFTRLVELDLGGNEAIEAIPEIGGLVELRELDISRNRITDISPLRTCTKLERLVLSKNRISDLTPVTSLPKLTSLVIDSALFGVDPDFGAQLNPATNTVGLEANPALANPFLLGRRLKVRLGRLSEGPAAQFTGTAERIGNSLRFSVALTRGNENRTDEWTVCQINSSPNTILDGPEGSQMLALFVKSLGESVLCWSLAGDRPNAIVDRTPGNTEMSIDASVIP